MVPKEPRSIRSHVPFKVVPKVDEVIDVPSPLYKAGARQYADSGVRAVAY